MISTQKLHYNGMIIPQKTKHFLTICFLGNIKCIHLKLYILIAFKVLIIFDNIQRVKN